MGAVITRSDNTIVSIGFNGLPKRVKDHDYRLADRELKYELIVHAEINAIVHTQERLLGCTIYTYPFQPCSRCAGIVIQSGLARVVSLKPDKLSLDRWEKSFALSKQMFDEAFVRLDLLEPLYEDVCE